jgi:hypothetical protein
MSNKLLFNSSTGPDGMIWQILDSSVEYRDAVYAPELSKYVAVGRHGVISTSTDGFNLNVQTVPYNRDLNAIVWSGSLFVAVGDAGTILTSPEGISWTKRVIDTTSDIEHITYSGTRFLAAGSTGGYFLSDDGIAWTVVRTLPGMDYVVWSPQINKFIAVDKGVSNSIRTSTDGTSWEGYTIPAGLPLTSISSVHVANARLFVGSTFGTYYTTDGISWTLVPIPESNSKFYTAPTTQSTNFTGQLLSGTASELVYDGSKYYATLTSNLHSSSDLTNWASETIQQRVTGITYISSLAKYIKVTQRTISTSSDLINWTTVHTTASPDLTITSIAASSNVVIASLINGGVIRSTNTTTWTYINNALPPNIDAVYWVGTQFIVIDVGTVNNAISSDGITWVAGTFVSAITGPGLVQDGTTLLMGNNYSTNSGTTWLSRSIQLGTYSDTPPYQGWYSNSTFSGPFQLVARYDPYYGRNIYFAVGGSGIIHTSSATSSWLESMPNATTLNGLITDGSTLATTGLSSTDLWVAVTTNGRVFTSSSRIEYDYEFNPSVWTEALNTPLLGTTPGSNSMRRVGSYLVIVADDCIFFSLNGTSWTQSGVKFATANPELRQFGATVIHYAPTKTYITVRVSGGAWANKNTLVNTTDIAKTSTTYVVVGTAGKIATSTDLNTWTQRTSGTSEQLNAVASNGASGLVAAGNLGVIVYSADNGATWSVRQTGKIYNITSVTYSNSRYVAVTDAGAYLYSADGLTWLGNQANGIVRSIDAITYGNNKFTLFDNLTTMHYIPDNSNVITQSLPTPASLTPGRTSEVIKTSTGYLMLNSIGGAGPRLLTSTDAVTWDIIEVGVTNTGTYYSLAQGPNSVVMVGSNTTLTTAGASIVTYANNTSTVINTGAIGGPLHKVIWDGVKFIAYGDGGGSAYSYEGTTWYNTDADKIGSYANSDTQAIINLGNEIFITKNASTINFLDAKTWKTVDTGSGEDFSIAKSPSIYVAVGDYGMRYSTDSKLTWLGSTTSTTTNLDVIWTGTSFIATGTSSIRRSVGGTTWTSISTGGLGIKSIASNQGTVVIVGTNIRYSLDDGLTWNTPVTPVYSGSLFKVRYIENMFIATGSNNILTSVDGITWTLVYTFLTGTYNDIIKTTGGVFVAVGLNGIISTSPDLINWSDVTYIPIVSTSTAADFTGITEFKETLFVIGSTDTTIITNR